MKQKIALFHPWIKSRGGAEKVVLDIAELKEFDIDVYTWIYEPDKTFEEFKKINVNVIGNKKLAKLSRTFFLRGLFLFVSFFSKIKNLEKYDKLLISSSGVGEFITFRNYKKGNTYAYIYTPLRAASPDLIEWSLKNYKSFFMKSFYLLAIKIYNFFEKKAWKRIDYPIFDSYLAMKRAHLKELLKKDEGEVIFAPVDTKKFSGLRTKREKYFLYCSRFNWNKRQDLVLRAWKRFSKNNEYKLILAGGRESEKYFNRIFKMAENLNNVEIKTDLSFKDLLLLYKDCFCGIFMGYKEDFGIVPLEYIAAKKPIIASAEGGYVDLISDCPNAFFISESVNEEKIINSIVRAFERVTKHKMKKYNLQKILFKEKLIKKLKKNKTVQTNIK